MEYKGYEIEDELLDKIIQKSREEVINKPYTYPDVSIPPIKIKMIGGIVKLASVIFFLFVLTGCPTIPVVSAGQTTSPPQLTCPGGTLTQGSDGTITIIFPPACLLISGNYANGTAGIYSVQIVGTPNAFSTLFGLNGTNLAP